MAEVWKPVLRHPYEVSDLGRVRSAKRVLKQQLKGRYLYVSIGRKSYRVHRLVCNAFHGMPLENRDLCGCHKNDVPTDNRAVNLFVGSQRENMADKVAKGRHSRWECHGNSKLNRMRVAEIRRLIAAGVSQRKIARQFDVNQSVISRINTGGAWQYA